MSPEEVRKLKAGTRLKLVHSTLRSDIAELISIYNFRSTFLHVECRSRRTGELYNSFIDIVNVISVLKEYAYKEELTS